MNQILVTESDGFEKGKKINNLNTINTPNANIPNTNTVNINKPNINNFNTNNFSTNNFNTNKKVSSRSKDIFGIIKVFCILILLFGIFLSGNGTYAMIREIENSKNSVAPVVTTQRNGNAVTILIKCDMGIRTITYAWNDSPEKVLQGKNKTELEQVVTVPSGDNRLNLTVIDSKGKQTKFVKNFIQAAEDTTPPKVEFEVVDSNVKIVATDDTALDYIVYKYGDSREVRIEAETAGQTRIEATVPVEQGQATLKVEAVDKAQNVASIEQEIKGVKKPVIEVIPDPNDASYLIIKARDEEGLRMVSYYINEQEYKTDPNVSLNKKTFEWRQKVERGETRVTVHAYNINEQVTEFIGIYRY